MDVENKILAQTNKETSFPQNESFPSSWRRFFHAENSSFHSWGDFRRLENISFHSWGDFRRPENISFHSWGDFRRSEKVSFFSGEDFSRRKKSHFFLGNIFLIGKNLIFFRRDFRRREKVSFFSGETFGKRKSSRFSLVEINQCVPLLDCFRLRLRNDGGIVKPLSSKVPLVAKIMPSPFSSLISLMINVLTSSTTVKQIREERGRGVILATKGAFENKGFVRALSTCHFYAFNQLNSIVS
jgi:hypothetical protein